MSSENRSLTINDKHGLRSLFEDMRESIAEAAGKAIQPEQVLRMMQIAASRQPKLFNCTRESVAKAVMDATSMGLDCSGIMGEGYLVPFFNGKIGKLETIFVPGYQGLIKLCLKTGMIRQVEARVVYERDEFSYEYGLEPKLIHRPPADASPRGGVKYAYAVARFADGSTQFEVMDIHELDAIRARHKSRDKKGNEFGPWKTDTSEMYRKCPVRRGVKYWPKSEELVRLLEIDNQQFGGDDAYGEPVDVTPKAQPKAKQSAVRSLEEKLQRAADGTLFNTGTGEVVEGEEEEEQHKFDLKNACLDLFQELNPKAAKNKLADYLQANFGVEAMDHLNLDQLKKMYEALQEEQAQ